MISDGFWNHFHCCYFVFKKFIVRSSVLNALLKDAQHQQDCVIYIPEVSEEAGRALLEYIYTDDLSRANNNSNIALELFQAAHAYGIHLLELRLKHLLTPKCIEWYGMGMVIQFFKFIREVECCKDMEIKVAQLLKR